MYRDNTKPYTPKLSAAAGGVSSTLKGQASQGRANKVPAGAGSVSSVNGQTPRPGYKQKSVKGGGTGSLARPGGPQGLNRGVNA